MSSFKNKQWANKKSRLYINFTQMYTSVKLAKQGLEDLSLIRTAREAVFCYAHARAFYLRLRLL
jgi:hypothetical protein